MPSFFKKSLELKIIAALALILALFMTLSSALETWLDTRGTYQIVYQQLDTLANTIQKSLIKDMRTGQSSGVQQILEMVGTEKGILGVRIFDEKGTILKSFDRAEIGKVIDPEVYRHFKAADRDFLSEKDGQRIMHVLHPIANSPACFGCHVRENEINGVLSIEFSLDPTQAHIDDHNKKALIVQFLTIFFVGLFVYILIKRHISGPIMKMKEAMAEAEKGNLDIAIPVRSEDEIASLQQSFNSMLARIKELNQENLAQQEDIIRKEQELKLQQALGEQNRALEAANREILEKNRYYLEMLSFISHELKNPLVVLKGYSSLLLNEDLGELKNAQREAVLSMEKNVDSISDMIANYLGLSRIERGELRPDKTETDLVADLLEPVVNEFKDALNRASMTLRVNAPAAPVSLYADKALMRSVLGNLISNAVKYGMPDSEVLVEAERSGDSVIISVFNEGEGIPREYLERVFERFTRLDNDTTLSRKGTGLGLCIVKEIVELHGGRVWAESKKGSWTRFVFTIPV
jgi:signal transduction histidine kinase